MCGSRARSCSGRPSEPAPASSPCGRTWRVFRSKSRSRRHGKRSSGLRRRTQATTRRWSPSPDILERTLGSGPTLVTQLLAARANAEASRDEGRCSDGRLAVIRRVLALHDRHGRDQEALAFAAFVRERVPDSSFVEHLGVELGEKGLNVQVRLRRAASDEEVRELQRVIDHALHEFRRRVKART